MSNPAVSVDNVNNTGPASYGWTISSGVETNGWCSFVTEVLALYPCNDRKAIYAPT
jgi:hypothetical protein